MPTLTVYVSPGDYDWLRKVAQAEEKSVSTIFRECVAVFRQTEREGQRRGRK